MASMKLEEQLEEQPPEKKLPSKDLSSACHSRPLPLELNCEIFACLKLPNQRKFICGLGRGIYEIFGQKLLKKAKKVSMAIKDAFCYLSCEHHIFEFECPRDSGEAIRPEWKPNGNIIGCGLLLYLNDKLSIFFTVNGKLMDGQIPISPSVDRLYPTITVFDSEVDFSLDANFGDDPAKPFEYDIINCPGLGLACIREEMK